MADFIFGAGCAFLLATFVFLLYCLRHPTARAAVARSPRVGEAPRTQLQGRAHE